MRRGALAALGIAWSTVARAEPDVAHVQLRVLCEGKVVGGDTLEVRLGDRRLPARDVSTWSVSDKQLVLHHVVIDVPSGKSTLTVRSAACEESTIALDPKPGETTFAHAEPEPVSLWRALVGRTGRH